MTDTPKIDPFRDGKAVVWFVCGSHRAREKLVGRASGRRAYNLAFTDKDISHHGIYPIELSDARRAARITGIRMLALHRVPFLQPCWDM